MRLIDIAARCLKCILPMAILAAVPGMAQAPEAPASPAAPTLAKADVDAWLDGMIPYGLATGDIAGAVIVVVKDGTVLTSRGYGFADMKTRKPVDPDATLFRPGSISKLFTWTAVMQQVQAGKLDLDRDINAYLDFKIAPAFGKPITLRNLMTHTSGFEETAKYLIKTDTAHVTSLEAALKRSVPARIYAPGSTAAYSNYGASLAGYIVQRVSGEPFDAYVQRHIFAPLQMTRSSFVQPLTPALAAGLSKGYANASGDPQAYEVIAMAPAGSLSATGSDMAKFMIAHLSASNPLLDPKTAALMHATANTPIPGMPGMALGFYHEDRDGLTIIGHGGDTNWFHSDLHLYLDKGVGIFMSFNSLGKQGAAGGLREKVFDEFTARYFPHAAAALPTQATAAEHGRAMAGSYVSSRGSLTNWLRIATLLGESTVSLNSDNTLTISGLNNAAGVPKRWREVAPWQWQEVGGEDRLGAATKDGKVTAFAPRGIAPIILFLPAPAGMNGGVMLPAMSAALGIVLLTALCWPIVALARYRFGYRPTTAGRTRMLGRATYLTAWILLIVAAGWLGVLVALSTDVANLDGRLDIWMRALQVLSLAGIVGTALTVWNAWTVATGPKPRLLATARAALVALSAVFLVWLMFAMNTLSLSLTY